MAELPHMPLFTDAYIADTMHLSLAEHGAYLKLLMIMWRTPNCEIADDKNDIARMLGITPKEWETKIRPRLEAFFVCENGVIFQKRLRKEHARAMDIKTKKSEAGKRGGRPAKSLKDNETEKASAFPDEKQNDKQTTKQNGSKPKASIPIPSYSVPNGTDGKPSEDILFQDGLQWLMRNSGVRESHCRSNIGRWLKVLKEAEVEKPPDTLLEVFRDARSERVAQPIEWITAAVDLRIGKRHSDKDGLGAALG